MEYTDNRIAVKEVVENFSEIHDILRKKYITTIITPFQELQLLQLAAQVQQNLFLHQANFTESGQALGQYEQPNGDIAGLLVDIHTQLENLVTLMEQKSAD